MTILAYMQVHFATSGKASQREKLLDIVGPTPIVCHFYAYLRGDVQICTFIQGAPCT